MSLIAVNTGKLGDVGAYEKKGRPEGRPLHFTLCPPKYGQLSKYSADVVRRFGMGLILTGSLRMPISYSGRSRIVNPHLSNIKAAFKNFALVVLKIPRRFHRK